MAEQLQVTETKAKEVSKELKSVYGVIASPEAIKAFNLGLGLRGEWAHSKKELIQKFLAEVYGDISVPETDIYQKYVRSQPKLKKHQLPGFMKY